MKNKKHYKYLDFIRLISCIAVFLYHLNILKGGYLAVCIFFVLTGYLSFASSFNKKNFSIKNYYLSRLKNIYLPFIIVVFISIFIITLFPSINWVNLKPETTSTILGYNNFWQLSASLDYFARHVDSPFMHFWYISILLQFELVFPLLFIGIKKISKKNKNISLILLITLSLFGTFYFIYSSFTENIMYTYYNTFTRIFSIIFGITLAYINCYYKNLIPSKLVNSRFKNIVFFIYITILIIMFLTVDSTSKIFSICMILTSLITCRLIEYGMSINDEDNIFDKIIKSISSISYEIYLIQYPVIFLFQEFEINFKYSFLLIIGITIIISYILHFSLNFNADKNVKIKCIILKLFILSIFVLSTIFGLCKYLITKDHTGELKELENQLNINQELMAKRQEEYALKSKEEESNWNSSIENLENDEANLKDFIDNLHIVGIGDSVMLGAIKYLYGVFPKGYFDAKTSRTDWEANGILQRLKNKGMLGEPILFGLGTNGQCGDKCRKKIFNTVGNKKMFWITTTNRKMNFINEELKEISKNKDNVYVIDWQNESKAHNEYFLADKIHLNDVGKSAYSKYIYDEIYNSYLNDIKMKKERMIEERNERLKSKIMFYGNDLLLNSFELLNSEFVSSEFKIDNYTYESLCLKIKKDIDSNKLLNNYVLLFDSNFKISEDEYKKIIDLLEGKNVYVIFINSRNSLKYKKVNVINIDKDLSSNNNYLLVDRIHLSSEGNKYLIEKLKEKIK